ncbi:MAG: VWA domain-containing protein [Miltoncostaeaceae bacterium]
MPLLAVAALAMLRGRRRAALAWADPAVLPGVARAARPGALRVTAAVLALLGVVAAVVAMARPSVTASEERSQSTVMLAVDISTSMNRTDLAPNRLVAAVDAAGRFLDEVPDDTSVGLVTFADGARVEVAPTRDRGRVRSALGRLETVRGETALGEAVVTALASLQSVGAILDGSVAPGEASGRVLILTDGVDSARLATTPAQAAERAAALGVPIFPLLLGDDPGEPGGATPAETLAQMATRTGGIFAQSVTAPDLRAVFADIGSVVVPVERLRELTVWCAAAALVLLLLAGVALGLSARPGPQRIPSAVGGPHSS